MMRSSIRCEIDVLLGDRMLKERETQWHYVRLGNKTVLSASRILT